MNPKHRNAITWQIYEHTGKTWKNSCIRIKYFKFNIWLITDCLIFARGRELLFFFFFLKVISNGTNLKRLVKNSSTRPFLRNFSFRPKTRLHYMQIRVYILQFAKFPYFLHDLSPSPNRSNATPISVRQCNLSRSTLSNHFAKQNATLSLFSFLKNIFPHDPPRANINHSMQFPRCSKHLLLELFKPDQKRGTFFSTENQEFEFNYLREESFDGQNEMSSMLEDMGQEVDDKANEGRGEYFSSKVQRFPFRIEECRIEFIFSHL